MEKAKHASAVPQSTAVGHCSSTTSNGCALSASTSHRIIEDDDYEHAGVFDYMPVKSLAKGESSLGHVLNGVGSDDLAEEAIRHRWARDSAYNSNVECLNDKELTTFHCSTGLNHAFSSDYNKKHGTLNGGIMLDDASEPDESLEEIVVQTEVVPQRATYERYNSDFRAQRYPPASNTDPVYITNIQRSGEDRNGYWANCGDERDIVERRSVQNTQYANSSSSERHFKANDGDQDDCRSATSVHNDTSTSSGNDNISSVSAIPRPFNSNILYLNDLWSPRTQSGITSSGDTEDGSSSRYYGAGNNSVGPGGPRTETIRRLMRKLQKRRTDQPTIGAVVTSGPSSSVTLAAAPVCRSEDVAEYKGDLPFDEVLAFINDLKAEETRQSRSKAASTSSSSNAVPQVKEISKTSVRKKKKYNQNIFESNTGNIDENLAGSSKQAIGDDKSVSSGSEAPDRVTLDTTNDVLQKQVASSQEMKKPSCNLTSSVLEDFGYSNELDQFVVVQKKKKVKSVSMPLGKASEFDNRRKYKNPTPSYASRIVNVRPVDFHTSNVRRPVDVDSASLPSDAESSSSLRERGAANQIQLSATDFPNLLFDEREQTNTLRNSLGGTELVDNTNLSHSITASYAVVAAAGLTFASGDAEQRQASMELQGTSNQDKNPSTGSHHSINETSEAQDHSSCSSSAAVNGHSVKPSASLDALAIDSSCTSSGICRQTNIQMMKPKSASEIAVISESVAVGLNDTNKRIHVAERSHTTADKELPINAQRAVAEASHPGSASLRAAVTAEKKTGVSNSVPPVVFMDVSSNLLSTTVSELTFGFDSNDSHVSEVPPVMSEQITRQTECSLPTCARCAGVNSADRASSISVATSTDCATSPIEQQDFLCSPHSVRKSAVVSWATTSHHVNGYCRPIVPLSTSHSASHPPIGIVPPIPHVDRTQITDTFEYKDSKMLTSVERIMSSIIISDQKSTLSSCESQYIEATPILAMEKPVTCQDQLAMTDPVVSEISADGLVNGSFCLLSAQIFLYKGFEDTLAERNRSPDSVIQYTWNE